jgi:hypothetical protein
MYTLTEQRWLTVIQNLQSLILQALTNAHIAEALRLWQALHAVLEAAVDKQEIALPWPALGQLLQKSFLVTLAPYLDNEALKQLCQHCLFAARQPEMIEQAAELGLTKVVLSKVLPAATLQTFGHCSPITLPDLAKLQDDLGTCVQSYTVAVRMQQTKQQQEAFTHIKKLESDFLNALGPSAWDTYLRLCAGARRDAIQNNKMPSTIPLETHLLALEWLVTLSERQLVLPTPQESILFAYREHLTQLRQAFQAAIATLPAAATLKEANAILLPAQRTFSRDIRALFAQMVQASETALGPAPCAYAFIGFGSLSRDEMLPYSDLECALIVQPDLSATQAQLAQAYFTALWQWFSFSLQGLGESGENGARLGLHLDDQLCPKITMRGLQGSYNTPEELFYENIPPELETSPPSLSLPQTYSLLKPVYITGQSGPDGWDGPRLMAEYHRALTARLQQLQHYPSPVQQAVAWAQLSQHLEEWQDVVRNSLALQITLSLKTDFATPLLCLVYDIALYHMVDITNPLPTRAVTGETVAEGVTNSYEIVTTLVEQKHLSPVFGRSLQNAYLQIMSLRFQVQQYYQQQLEEIVLPHATDEEVNTVYMKDKFLRAKLEARFIKPNSTQLYRLTIQPYTHLQCIRAFLFEPVVKLLEVQADTPETQPLLSWQDPLQDQLALLLNNGEVQIAWIHQLVTHLLASDADLQVHQHCYNTLTRLHIPEPLRAAYLDVLPRTDPILLHLSTLPRPDGYRQSERLAYSDLMSALRSLGLAIPESSDFTLPDNNDLKVILSSPSTGRRLLHHSVVAQLIDPATGDIKTFDPTIKSLHNVGRVQHSGHTIHVKQRPYHPGMDYGMDIFHRRLFGHGTTPNELAVLTVISPRFTRRYPILFSTTVPGLTLAAALQLPPSQQPHWNKQALTELCLTALLTFPGDGASRNFIVRSLPNNEATLVCIDSNVAFVEPVVKIGGLLGKHKLQVATILFGMPEIVQEPLSRTTLETVCQWDTEALLHHWLDNLEEREKAYEALFEEKELQQLYQADINNPFTPAILFRQGTLALLALDLRYLQSLCRLALQTQQPLTPWQLLQKLQPRIAKYYQPALAKLQLTPEQRMEIAMQTIRGSLSSCQSLTAALGKVPTLEEVIAKTTYSTRMARQELAILRLEQFEENTLFSYQQDGTTDFWHVRADFTSLQQIPEMLTRQQLILQALMGRRYQELILVGCTALDDNLLQSLLSESAMLHTLRLRQCPQITQDSLIYLAKYCPQLTTLELTGTALAKVASPYLNRPLVFPQLTTLYMIGAKVLHSIHLQAPLLQTFSLQQALIIGTKDGFTYGPKSLLLAPQLKTADFCYCPGITETWLATMLRSCNQLQKLTLTRCQQVLYRELKEAIPSLGRVILAEMPTLIPYLENMANPQATALDMKSLKMTEQQFLALALALGHTLTITELNLTACGPLTHQQLVALQRVNQLEVLYLQQQSALQGTLELAWPRLRILSIRECSKVTQLQLETPFLQHLDASYCSALTSVILQSVVLTNADFKQCVSLADTALVQLVSHCSSLQVLQLEGCSVVSFPLLKMQYPPLAALSSSLLARILPCLEHASNILNLSSEHLGTLQETDYQALTFILRQLAVTTVLLSVTGLDDAHLQYLAPALKNNYHLTEIDLSWNHLTDEGAKTLIEILQHNPAILRLNWHGNNISATTDQALTERLQRPPLIPQVSPSARKLVTDIPEPATGDKRMGPLLSKVGLFSPLVVLVPGTEMPSSELAESNSLTI